MDSLIVLGIAVSIPLALMHRTSFVLARRRVFGGRPAHERAASRHIASRKNAEQIFVAAIPLQVYALSDRDPMALGRVPVHPFSEQVIPALEFAMHASEPALLLRGSALLSREMAAHFFDSDCISRVPAWPLPADRASCVASATGSPNCSFFKRSSS